MEIHAAPRSDGEVADGVRKRQRTSAIRA